MNQELYNAVEIAGRDAAEWTSQDVQTLADAYREAWDSQDCEALEALSNAMSDINYGVVGKVKVQYGEYDYARDYSVVPDAEKYGSLLGALGSNKEGELYYTLSRMSMMPTEVQTLHSDVGDVHTANFAYDFENTDSGMQVSLSTSAQGVEEKNLYTITAVDMNEKVSADSISRLKNLGYAENEIATLKASALTDTDVEFIGKLAAGNYEAAYRVDPSGLSDFAKVELSTYQAILGTRTDSEVGNAEIQKQINILLNQDIDHIMNGPADNAYPEYVSLIAAGLQQQSLKYGENMEELYDAGIYITDEYFNYGDKLNRTVALWDSFDIVSREDDLKYLERIYGVGLREGVFDLQVMDLQTPTEYGQYQYKLNVVDGKTGEVLPEQYGMEVVMEKLSAIDALRTGYVAENVKNTKELENIKKNTVINASVALVDGLYPFPLKDTFELFNAVEDVTLNTSDITGRLNMASHVGELDSENETLSAVGDVSSVAGSVFETICSGISDYKETQAEIAYNNEYLTYCFNGQLSQMKFYMGLETGSGETQVINVGRNCMAPEVQYNMMRWQKEGISVYLQDIGLSEEKFETKRQWIENKFEHHK